MKNAFFCLIFVIFCVPAFAQIQTPQFLMPLWFEDAIGNRDTLWLGGDYNASSQNINPQFGEQAITAPFDSVFEVRAVHGRAVPGDDVYWETSKIIVEFDENGPFNCYYAAHTRIMIHALHPPVRISWDTTYLLSNAPCHYNTILAPTQLIFLFQYWYEASPIHCMMTREEILEDFSHLNQPSIDWLQHPFQVQGQGERMLPGLYFSGFFDSPSICYEVLDADGPAGGMVQLPPLPNPASGELPLVAPLYQGADLALCDLGGRPLRQWASVQVPARLDLQGIASGAYVLRGRLPDGRFFVQKLLKI